MRVLLSAYACDPSKGSEAANGWNWAIGLGKLGLEVHVLTSEKGKPAIDRYLSDNSHENVFFHFVSPGAFWAKAYYFNFVFMYISYIIWQVKAFSYSKQLHKKFAFQVAHHVTWGSLKVGSLLYKLKIPLIFGPVGGGQTAPLVFKRELEVDYPREFLRTHLGPKFAAINPLCRKIISKAAVVLVTNRETEAFVSKLGCKNPQLVFDAALPAGFGPSSRERKDNEKLQLLWVGRLYAFKGLQLIIKAISKLSEADKRKVHLTVVGDGPYGRRIRELCVDLDLQNEISFKGSVPFSRISEFYRSADIFVFTSLRDSFPSQILEAQGWGLPVITLDLHGQALLVSSDRGVKCHVSGPEETITNISNSIAILANNSQLVDELGERAFRFAQQQTWKNKIETIVENFYPKTI